MGMLKSLLSSVSGAIFNKWTAAAVGAEIITNNGDGQGGIITRPIRKIGNTVIGESSTLQGQNASLDAQFGSMAKMNGVMAGLAWVLDLVGEWIPAAKTGAQWARDFSRTQEQKMRDINEEFQSGAESPDTAATATNIAENLQDPDSLLGLGVAGATAYGLHRSAKTAAAAAAAATEAGETVARAAPRLSSMAGRGGRWGILAGIAGAAAITLGLTGEADAAIAPTQPEVSAREDFSAAANVEPTEASLSETLTVGGAAVVAAKTLGLRAVPVLGGVLTGWDTLTETAGYVWEGEWEQAGTSLVAGAGLTVAATGGILTYGLGEAWHAAVRDGAVSVLGEDATIEKAPVRELFEIATGMNTDMYSTPQRNYDTLEIANIPGLPRLGM